MPSIHSDVEAAMRTDRLQMLIDELRRGEFIQGQGLLRAPGQHCALGVACELFRRETNRGRWLKRGERFAFSVSDPRSNYRNMGFVPSPVIRWYLNDPSDRQLHRALAVIFWRVASRNDGGVPFEELADLIESFIAGEAGAALTVG